MLLRAAVVTSAAAALGLSSARGVQQPNYGEQCFSSILFLFDAFALLCLTFSVDYELQKSTSEMYSECPSPISARPPPIFALKF